MIEFLVGFSGEKILVSKKIGTYVSKNKKNIFNAIFLIAVFGFTMYSIFNGKDLGDIFSKVFKTSPLYIIIGVACVIFFIYLESYIVEYLLESLTIKTKRFACFLYSCVGFFFGCVTPAGSGGQPAKLYYMQKDKIPIPIATVVLLIVTITYKFVLVMIGLFVLVFQHGFMDKYLGSMLVFFYLGLGLNVICVAGMLILTFNQKLAKSFVMKCLKILGKLKILKDSPKRVEKFSKAMDSYNDAAKYLKDHKMVIAKVLFITLIQRFVLFFATYFTYKAFGLKGTSMYDVVMLQAVIAVAVDMLPIPGGLGVSEGIFGAIFLPVFGPELIVPGMLISRGLGYYTQLIVSAAMTCVAHFTVGKNKLDEEILYMDSDTIQ